MFWSDDYTGGSLHEPRGQYWSGDRELRLSRAFSSAEGRSRRGRRTTAHRRHLQGQAAVGLDVLFYAYQDFTLADRAWDTKAYPAR
jgi:hypothetical protein